ncbi:hypothetical protein FS837_001788 [Tulasnella sp. UAMH 9824]|nr:hypothetical protein FS837_001788 [Tulasnella sp. UAMH 9824]
MAIVVNVDNGRLLLATNFSAFCQAYPQKNYALVVKSDLKFEGFGGTTQVTQFITFIRRKALAASRSRDKEWIADFAATHLDGEAFLWHLNLDQAVQMDWDKLQRALVERYSAQAAAQSPGSTKYLSLPTPKRVL